MRSHLTTSSFSPCTLGAMSKKPLLNPKQTKINSFVFFNSFKILVLTCIICFEFIFQYSVGKRFPTSDCKPVDPTSEFQDYFAGNQLFSFMPYKFLLHTMGRLSLTETKSFFHHFVKICCCCSVPKSCSALRNPMDCSMAGFLVLHYLPKFAQTPVELVMPPTHLILCHPLLLLLSTFPSIRVFSNESKYGSPKIQCDLGSFFKKKKKKKASEVICCYSWHQIPFSSLCQNLVQLKPSDCRLFFILF